MASDVMRVRLHLREIRVLAVASDTPSELRVEVESTVRRPRCPACGFRCVRVHDTRRRKVRDLEVSGRRTTLVWLRRRFVCDNCSTRHLEDHPEFENKLTRRLSRRLVADARVMTLRAAARRHDLSCLFVEVRELWERASTGPFAYFRVRVRRIVGGVVGDGISGRGWASCPSFGLSAGRRGRWGMCPGAAKPAVCDRRSRLRPYAALGRRPVRWPLGGRLGAVGVWCHCGGRLSGFAGWHPSGALSTASETRSGISL